jgi:hypothetical protein
MQEYKQEFTLVLGQPNNYLPGKLWTQYMVTVLDDRMKCVNKKTHEEFEISYSEFKEAEFGIGNGNLWLQCKLNNGPFVFCSPRKCWKSKEGKLLIDKINRVVEIKDMKEYEHYTGKLFFLYMFK